MSTTTSQKILLLGPAGSGKTTYLIQLHGRLARGEGALKTRGAPRRLGPIEAGVARLQQGLSVEHTRTGTKDELNLPARTATGEALDVRLPEYAGEDLETVMRDRRLPEQWRAFAAESQRWLVLLRPTLQPVLQDVITKPLGVLAMASSTDEPIDKLPLDMWAVELLQTLLYARRLADPAAPRPSLGIVISCWDELAEKDGTPPSEVAAKRLSLLAAFARTHWPKDKHAIFGLSSQGQALDKEKPNDDFVDMGPEEMGFVVMPDSSVTSDLTVLACF